MSALPAQVPPPDYQEKAKEVYGSLIKAYTDDNVTNYWQLGNAFGAIIEFCQAIAPDSWSVLDDIYAKQQLFEQRNKIDCLWFDDYLWWAIASLETKKPNNPLEPRWIEVFNSNWDQALRGLKVWDNHQDRQRYKPFRPRFDNGIWNAEWNPRDPWSDAAGLKGIQNAVVNTLFLTAAAQATNLRDYLGKDYSGFVNQEYGFLQQWFDPELANDCLLYTFQGRNRENCALIHERVNTFYDKSLDPHYDPKFFWTGDQGLLLAALMSMSLMPGVPDPVGYITFAREIINGVNNHLVDAQKLLPWPKDVFPPDTDDYNSGTGVFTRYICKAWRTNSVLKLQLKNTDFNTVITQMADKLLTFKPPDKPSNDDLNPLSNNLSILVAAAVMQNSPNPMIG